ncbi:serine-rich adhesin for platelets isoform X2 [Drosophila obscura]|uniref:serine-rich adhesin for platelets isoform X2 n=1 Tax=Drosophila obscura TaxID=7282 RepID=UPI001BB17EEB|nr:serine-rich adhesin for platelets isoform X2 [Drosophila obscura]
MTVDNDNPFGRKQFAAHGNSIENTMDDFVKNLIEEVKSQGVFDEFRFNCCLADVDTKPAYQNVRNRVETAVQDFLAKQRWTPDTNKVQLRERLRKHLLDSDVLEKGVDQIVDQVVNPKVATIFEPKIESIAYKYLGITPPPPPTIAPPPRPTLLPAPPLPPYAGHMNGSSLLNVETSAGLLPTDLEQISPDSDRGTVQSDGKDDSKEDDLPPGVDDRNFDDDTSPSFEPLSEDKPANKDDLNNGSLNTLDSVNGASQASQLSQVSSDSRLTIASYTESVVDGRQPTPTSNSVELTPNMAANISEEAQMPKFSENSNDASGGNHCSRPLHFDIKQDAITFEGTERRNSVSENTNGGSQALSIEDAIMSEVKANIEDASNASIEPVPAHELEPVEQPSPPKIEAFSMPQPPQTPPPPPPPQAPPPAPETPPPAPKTPPPPQAPPPAPEAPPPAPKTPPPAPEAAPTAPESPPPESEAPPTKPKTTELTAAPEISIGSFSEAIAQDSSLKINKIPEAESNGSEIVRQESPLLPAPATDKVEEVKEDVAVKLPPPNETPKEDATKTLTFASSQSKSNSKDKDKERDRRHHTSSSDDKQRRKSREPKDRDADRNRHKSQSQSKHSSSSSSKHSSSHSSSKHKNSSSSSAQKDKSSSSTSSSRTHRESSSSKRSASTSSSRHETSSSNKKHKSSSSSSRSDRDKERSKDGQSQSHRSHQSSSSSGSSSKKKEHERSRDRDRNKSTSSTNSTSAATPIVQDDHNEIKAKLQKRRSSDSNDEGKPPPSSGGASHIAPLTDPSTANEKTDAPVQYGDNSNGNTNGGSNGATDSAVILSMGSSVINVSDILQQSTTSFIELCAAGSGSQSKKDADQVEKEPEDKALSEAMETESTPAESAKEDEQKKLNEELVKVESVQEAPVPVPVTEKVCKEADEISIDLKQMEKSPTDSEDSQIADKVSEEAATEEANSLETPDSLAEKQQISAESSETPTETETGDVTCFEHNTDEFKARLELINVLIADRDALLNKLSDEIPKHVIDVRALRRTKSKRRLDGGAAGHRDGDSESESQKKMRETTPPQLIDPSSSSSSGSPVKRLRRNEPKASPTPSDGSINSKENEAIEKQEPVQS